MQKSIILLFLTLFVMSCGSKKDEYDPYAIKQDKSTEVPSSSSFEVKYTVTPEKLKTIHMKINNANGYDVLFDTGCSGMLISQLELIDLIKSGTISDDDYRRIEPVTIADGSMIKQPVYNIREISVTDTKGQSHTLNDIEATVVNNIGANILIGTSVIDNLAKKSYTVDLQKKIIRFD